MKSEIMPVPSNNTPATPTTINQYGEKSVHVGHATAVNQTLNVNVTYFIPQPGRQALQVTTSLSRDYYNLFVIGGEEFCGDHFLVPKDRALTKGTLADDVFERLSTLTPEAIEEIKSYPALFASENTNYRGKTDKDQQAIYGLVTDIRVQDNGIKIYYHRLNYISQQAINDIAFNLGIRSTTALTELNRTHWTIKRIDLIEALMDAGISVMAPTLQR